MADKRQHQGPLHHLQTDYPPGDAPVDKLGLDGGVQRRLTSNVYEQACTITAWQQLYDQLLPGPFSGELKELWLDQLQCFEEHTSRALRQSCVVWPGAYWFGLPQTEGKEASRDCHRIDDGVIAISAGGQEFELTTPDDYRIMGLVVPQQELEHYAAVTLDGGLSLALEQQPVLRVDAASKRRFIGQQRQILAAAEHLPLHAGIARKFMRHELLDGLLELLASAEAATASLRSRSSHWRVVRKARDYVLGQPDMPLVIADLCAHLNVSRRTLQNCFNSTLGICPLSYLKAIRLNAVRRELLSRDSAFAAVQDVAAAWGFWHMSQFAVDYWRLFGEKPSQTMSTR